MALATSRKVLHNVLPTSLVALGWPVLADTGAVSHLFGGLIILRMTQARHNNQEQQDEGLGISAAFTILDRNISIG